MIEVFHYLNEYAFFVMVAGIFFCASELSYLYGRYVSKTAKEDYSSQAGAFGGAMLGMMALLLGFSFSMALGRHDLRKNLLLDEINNVKSAYQYSDLINKCCEQKIKPMFAEYTQLRVNYYQKGTLAKDMKQNIVDTEILQNKMWALALDALEHTEASKKSAAMAFVNKLSDMFDDETKRVTARGNHVPEPILWLLIFVGAFALAINSYSIGLKHAHLAMPRFFLVIAITAVLTVILDLDRPIRGIIQIDQSEMKALNEYIKADVKNKVPIAIAPKDLF